MLSCILQATQVLKADDEREFIVVRDEYKGGDIRLSLRKFEVSAISLHATQDQAVPDVRRHSMLLPVTKGQNASLFLLSMLQESICWQRVKQMQEEDVTVNGKVVQINKGGVMVEVEHLRGFVPMSQIQNVSVGSLPPSVPVCDI